MNAAVVREALPLDESQLLAAAGKARLSGLPTMQVLEEDSGLGPAELACALGRIFAYRYIDAAELAAYEPQFNLLNSAAALAGAWVSTPALPPALPTWIIAAGAGALVGSWLGARHLPVVLLRYLLAVLLLAAGVRMIVS